MADPAHDDAAGEFLRLYGGRLHGVMTWKQLDALWQRVDPSAGWYLYAIGEARPTAPSPPEAVRSFVAEVDALLRREHRESYCGIVYADDLEQPRLVKIYDPNHLGVSCGSSSAPPLPGWVMSRVPPAEIGSAAPLPASRKRFWDKLFSR